MENKLLLIKLVHTLIWAVMAAAVFVVLAAGIFGFLNFFVYLSIGIILAEGAVLLVFRWSCPLTVVAGKYTENREANFDIFLPMILAKYNKVIFTTLFVIGLVLIWLRKFFPGALG